MYCRKVAVHALAVPALLGLVATAQPQSPDVADAPANPPVTARIAPQAEPGDPIEIVGTLVAPDGKAPVGGAVVYAYHTDATGEYRGSSDRPKLRGWARTDDSGRFTFLTIKPAPYPGARGPAHVHVHVWGAGYPRQWFELLFEGDTRLSVMKSVPKFFYVMPSSRPPGGKQSYAATLRLRTQSNFTSQ